MTIETADKLVALRRAKGLSQQQVAEAVGVSRQAVSRWEQGETSPDTDNLVALLKLYGTTLEELTAPAPGRPAIHNEDYAPTLRFGRLDEEAPGEEERERMLQDFNRRQEQRIRRGRVIFYALLGGDLALAAAGFILSLRFEGFIAVLIGSILFLASRRGNTGWTEDLKDDRQWIANDYARVAAFYVTLLGTAAVWVSWNERGGLCVYPLLWTAFQIGAWITLWFSPAIKEYLYWYHNS